MYDALAVTIERLIRAGKLVPDTRLPAERRLADELGVSRGTVMSAYQLLRDRMMVSTRHGSGTIVLRSGSPVSGPREAHVAASLTASDSVFRGLRERGSDTIDLRSATWLGTDDLPEAPFAQAFEQLRAERESHGYHLVGLPALRRAISDHLTRGGLPSSPDEILVTTGAQQALALVSQLFVAPHDRVIVEEFTYPGAIDVFATQHARMIPVATGSAGPELAGLSALIERHDPRLMYVVPSVHNPTGTVMPGAARARLAELAADWSGLIIDDRTLAETQIDGSHPAPLASYADPRTAQRIITVGSLSKMVWAGLRVGWIRAEQPLLSRLARLKAVSDLGTPVVTQLIAANLLEDGDEIFRARRATIAEHRSVLEHELSAALPGWTWLTPRGGLCLWVEIPGGDAEAFCRVAAEYGVAVAPGTNCSPDRQAGTGHVRLVFGHPVEVLRDAAGRLASAWKHHREVTPISELDSVGVGT